MKPNNKFCNQTPDFWATIKLISQRVGYTDRKTSAIRIPSIDEIIRAFEERKLLPHKFYFDGVLTEFGKTLMDYFSYRAKVLNSVVKDNLMNIEQAEVLFEELLSEQTYRCPIPKNKQTGKKATFNYYTGIINMLIDKNIGEHPCNYNASELTAFSLNKIPTRTLSRRVDGSFPGTINPIALWEIKEYYYTTSFGSRVADGVYETMLDGLELKEVRTSINIPVKHYLFVDAYQTWWDKGKSYLCRLIDIMHMGLVDEVIFGKEVLIRVPELCKEWIRTYRQHKTIIDS